MSNPDYNTEITDRIDEHRLSHATPGLEAGSGTPRGIRFAFMLLAIVVLCAVAYRLFAHFAAEHSLAETTSNNAVPTVNVTHPSVGGSDGEVALPGNTMAFDDTPIYARTNGYIKQWFVDIGQHVVKGQLMATIETPELDEQLQVAKADLKSSQANLNLANTTSERYQNLLKSDSVSKQETDVAVSGASAKRAAVEAAQANVRRLEQLQSFEKIYAPYSGVVTVRNVDIGDLINAGSSATSSTAKELFRIATVQQLRVFVSVPEIYAPNIHNGEIATLTLDEYPGHNFIGMVARNSNAIDPASRTLNVEVDVNNSDGKLLPGAYVFVHFKIPAQGRQLSLPSNTLLFRSEGMQVGIVRDGRVHLQHVTIGKDNGRSVEIATGVTSGDAVILDPSDSLSEGQQVQIASTAGGK